jgi:protein-L-isoaspartate(D-aspartate) O-methyltransferase
VKESFALSSPTGVESALFARIERLSCVGGSPVEAQKAGKALIFRLRRVRVEDMGVSDLPDLQPDPQAERMVASQIVRRGVSAPRLLEAMRRLPRTTFAPQGSGNPYADRPIPIGSGQTMSQPYMIAVMLEALGLRGTEKVLEIGTGSGYQTGLLAMLAAEVYTVERIEALLERARNALTSVGFSNVFSRLGDGSAGWLEAAPFDAIVVSAAAPRVPPSLERQLADNGVLVVPVAEQPGYQMLTIVKKVGRTLQRSTGTPCRFVPLLGREGYDESQSWT